MLTHDNIEMMPNLERIIMKKSDYLEVIVEQGPDKLWRLWVNDKEACILRAFKITDLQMRANGNKVLVIDPPKD